MPLQLLMVENKKRKKFKKKLKLIRKLSHSLTDPL